MLVETKNNSDVRSYKGANIDSDYFLIITKIRSRIAIMKEEKKPRQKRFEIDRLKSMECEMKYQRVIKKKLDTHEIVELDKDGIDTVNDK